MKRIVASIAACLLFLLPACSAESPGNNTPSGGSEQVEISLWTYPIGSWGDSGTVSQQLTAFRLAYPEIHISVHPVDYVTGDADIEAAIADGNAPDLVLEGPERLVANWGARGLMADIGDLWEHPTAAQIEDSVRVACHDADGNYFIYPMCMTTHCMAIDRDMFEEAGALQYVHDDTRLWSTDEFFAAVNALYTHYDRDVAVVYCGNQGGDQGTRALVNNLYGGTFTDEAHTRYTVDSAENIRALKQLKETPGIRFADDMVGTDEIAAFCKGELAMAFCWNVSIEINQTLNETFDFDVLPMAFPTSDEKPDLQGGIWGFGVFDNHDVKRLAAAKTFISFMLQDDGRYAGAVNASSYWPVREMPGIYDNDKLMNEYSVFGKYLGDYYQITPGWADARTAWWNMLKSIGGGTEVEDAVAEFSRLVSASE